MKYHITICTCSKAGDDAVEEMLTRCAEWQQAGVLNIEYSTSSYVTLDHLVGFAELQGVSSEHAAKAWFFLLRGGIPEKVWCTHHSEKLNFRRRSNHLSRAEYLQSLDDRDQWSASTEHSSWELETGSLKIALPEIVLEDPFNFGPKMRRLLEAWVGQL